MKTRILRFAVLAALFTVPALADAPVGQYDKFTKPSKTVHDLKTQLTWQRTAGDVAIQSLAESSCEDAGMRLPTIKELLTLVDESPHQEYENTHTVALYADQNAFGGQDTQSNEVTPVDSAYWSDTPGPAGKHWTLNFGTGATELDSDGDARRVRCVSP